MKLLGEHLCLAGKLTDLLVSICVPTTRIDTHKLEVVENDERHGVVLCREPARVRAKSVEVERAGVVDKQLQPAEVFLRLVYSFLLYVLRKLARECFIGHALVNTHEPLDD